jgi:alpha-beta hydrolase superfamily lysophospholipase
MESTEVTGFDRRDRCIAAAAALAALAVYCFTLAPTITGEDSGEFVTAAKVLGVTHPPGYPLYCMVAHAFTWLPAGGVAWRVNFMSAVFGAATVYLLALTVILYTRNRLAAVAAGLLFAFSKEFWEQSVVAEVYTLTAFFLVLCLLLLFQWERARKDRLLVLLAVAFGLGTSVHNTFMLLAPWFALFVLMHDGAAAGRIPGPRRWGFYAGLSALSALLCLGVLLYIPLRAAADPAVNWGNPEGLAGFWRHIRRMQYDFMVTQYPRSFDRFLDQMGAMGAMYLRQPLLCADLAGFLILLWRRPGHALFLAACAASVVTGFTLWQNPELTRDWLWVMSVFSIPAYLTAALCAGVFFDAAWRRRPLAAAVLMVVCIAVPLGLNWRTNDKSRYYWAYDYGVNVLNSLDKNAIYVSASDHGGFSVLYLQKVEGLRPDVANARTYGYVHLAEFERLPEDLKQKAGPFPRRALEPELFAWLIHNTTRPVYFEEAPVFPPESRIRLVPAGLLWRALRPDEVLPSEQDYWAGYRWPSFKDDRHGDFTADTILCDIHLSMAQGQYFRSAQQAEPDGRDLCRRGARSEIEYALAAYGRDPAMLNNAGALSARYGDHEYARALFREALERLPGLAAARNNLERLGETMETPKSTRTLSYYVRRFPMLLLLAYMGVVAVFYFAQRPMLFQTDRAMILDPSAYNWPFENIVLDVDGKKTHGWFVPRDNARGVVLFSHGNAGNISGRLESVGLLRAMGFSVLVYDYGGYGNSTGNASEKRCYADARAMWKWLTETKKVPAEKILLFGRSLGGAVTCDLAAEVTPRAVVMESTFLSVPEVAAGVFPWLPVRLLASYKFASVNKIAKIHVPLLMVHSPDDTMIPYEHGRKLFELANEPKTFVEIHGDHNDGFVQSKDVYLAAWKKFIDPLFPQP